MPKTIEAVNEAITTGDVRLLLVEIIRTMDLIRLGDTTDYGGEVITASESMRYGGRRVARKGDEVSCPRHPDVKPNVIMEGDDSMCDGGIPIARHWHQATCGCHLISSLL